MATLERNGYRFRNFYMYERKKHQPYDYRRKGLLNRILSNKVYNSKNKVLQAVLQEYNRVIMMWMDYADILWNFKNARFKNR